MLVFEFRRRVVQELRKEGGEVGTFFRLATIEAETDRHFDFQSAPQTLRNKNSTASGLRIAP
jgi:hypothetical protein